MANKIQYIDNVSGDHVFPVTHERGVLDSKEVNLETKLMRPLAEWHVDGAGDEFTSTTFGEVMPGRKYRLHIKSWPNDEVTQKGSNYAQCAIYKNSASSSGNVLAGAFGTDIIAAYYDITIPSDCESLILGGRVNLGAEGIACVEDITFSNGIDEDITEISQRPLAAFSVVGMGNTYVSDQISTLIPLHTYRIHMLSWQNDEVTSNENAIVITSSDGEATTLLKEVRKAEGIADYYDISVPEDSIRVFIGGRLNSGETGSIQIEDITLSKSISSRIDDICASKDMAWRGVKLDIDEVIQNKYVSGTGNLLDSTILDIYVYDVEPGNMYAFSGHFGSANPLNFIAWFNEEGIFLRVESYKGPSISYYRQKVVAPQGAAFAYTNIQKVYAEDFAFYSLEEEDVVPGFQKEIDALIENINYEEVNILSLPKRIGYISQYANVYQYSTSRHVLVPVQEGQFVRLVSDAENGNNLLLAWMLSDAAPVIGEAPDLVPGTATWFIPGQVGGKTVSYVVPPLARFLYVYVGNAPYPYTPSYIGLSSSAGNEETPTAATIADSQFHLLRERRDIAAQNMGLIPLSIPVDAEGWEIPQTVQQLNSLKKALQFINIKWTPKATLPGKHDPSGTAHPAGVEQTGIPYSSNWHEYKHVGIEVSLHTFMTAVNNPYSLLYTENISKTGSKSAWGKTYNNTNGWMYYGTVCCAFTSSVNGQPTKYGNDIIPKAGKTFGVFVPLDPQDARVLRIGDIGNNPRHSWLVYGLHRTNGEIDKITIAESTGETNSCRLVTRTLQEFNEYIAAYSYILYRVPDLYRNIDYAPSPYVPLTEYGESATPVSYNNDICCFAGDKATFAVGDRVVVNYNLGDTPSREWTAIQLYKNSNLIQTYNLAEINQSELPVGQRNHALDLGTTLSYGRYRARLTDGANYSEFTYWEVVPTNVTISVTENNEYKIKLSSTVYKIRYVYCGQNQVAGFFYTRAGREPSWYEAKENAIYLCYDELIEEWGFNPSNNNQVRVMIEGIYGMAATPPITLPGRSDEEDDDPTPDDPSDDDND